MNQVPENASLVVCTIAMPKDTNVYGDIFGGWLVSQMDLGGAVLAHQLASRRVTTVAIDQLTFIKPVYVGDTVRCYAHVVRTGKSSIAIQMMVVASRFDAVDDILVAQGLFTFVALDAHGQPVAVDWPKC